VFYVEPAPPPISLLEVGPAESAAPYPYAETFALHSKPGAKRTIYLDFNGHVVSDSAWHESFALAEPTVAAPFDLDGEPGSFTKAEKSRIQSIWQRVAEDYSPFNVDVTTEPPGLASLNRSGPADSVYGTRVVITDTPAFCSCAGVAYLGAFDDIGQYRQPAWVFSNSLSDSAKMVAEAASHETGHNLGLFHDGHGADPYYSGHDPWAPIMGSGYYQPVVQFSAGAYSGASQQQDDLEAITSNGLKKRGDDHANAKAGSTLVTFSRSGIVTSAGDTDVFRFVAPSDGEVSIVVKPAPVSPNLDVHLEGRSASWILVAKSAPVVNRVGNDETTGMDASFDLAVKEGKKYYLTVRGSGYATPATGYPRYGSLGQYTLKVIGVTNDHLYATGHLAGSVGSRVGSNIGASGQSGEKRAACAVDGAIRSVWWTWTAPKSGTAVIDTLGSKFDTVLSVYTGGKVTSLAQVPGGCSNDISTSNLRSKVVVEVVAGKTYRIRVDGVGKATGKVELNYALDS
jgi:hypothetical protein